jgi:hypothetical protein
LRVLFRKQFWAGIADGSVTVAVRRWKRPTVKAGGTLRTPAGFLAIDAVEVIDDADLDEAVAAQAGYESVDDLRRELGPPSSDRRLYRIVFHRGGDDPRAVLRADDLLSDDDVATIRARLDRLDRVAPQPWTDATLRAIAAQPGVVSTSLAADAGMERAAYKANVRKLKALGLTESLDVGYRLLPRGAAFLATQL